jgi:phage-related protein
VAADTAAGKWQRTQVAFNETKESIGAGLLPVMEAAAGKMAAFGGWAANNTGTVTKLAVAFGILSAAVLVTRGVMAVYNTVQAVSIALQKAYAKEGLVYAAVQGVIRVATLAWVAVQWLLNAALIANPIGIVIVVIAALVVAIVLAYKKSDTFRAIVQGAFRAVVAAGVWLKNALIAAFNAVKTALGAVVKFVSTYVVNPIKAYFQAVVTAAKLMASAVGAAWSGMKAALQAVLGWINSNVIGPLKSAFASVVDAVRAVIDWIGRIKIPSAVSKIIGKIGGVFSVAPAPPPPAPTVSTRRGRGVAGTRAADQSALGPGGTRDPLAALTVAPEVIVQVSDRKMAQLVDVSIRANATSAARNLTRRRVVTV